MTIVIIQARMSSTRLPGKVLMEIDGKPILQHIVEKCSKANGVDRVVVATSTDHSDDAIVNHCGDWIVPMFRGSLEDVLDRYYKCAKKYKAETIIRITADCPLVPIYEIERVLTAYKRGISEYVSNRPYAYDGHDVEVFSFRALEYTWKTAVGVDREHVTLAMKMNVDLNPTRLPSQKLSIDDIDDYNFITSIYETR